MSAVEQGCHASECSLLLKHEILKKLVTFTGVRIFSSIFKFAYSLLACLQGDNIFVINVFVIQIPTEFELA